MQHLSYQSPTNADIAGLGTDPIPAGPYYQAEYFELEREAIFRRSWLHIGHVCELPKAGSFIVRPLETVKASLLLTRGTDDRIRAFHNVCTHRGTQLVDDACGTRSSFTCRYHAWTYNLDGRLRAAPDFERFYVDKARCGLPEVAVEVCAGLIFVNLDPSPAQGLREFLGPLAEQLEAMPVARATGFSEWVYELDANWKLIWDNFQENYHLRFIHSRSAGPAACGEDNPFGYAVNFSFHGPHRKQLIWSNPAPTIGQTARFGFGKLAQFAHADGLFDNPHVRDYFALFPSFSIIGTPTGHFSQCVTPISATRSRGAFRMYWVGDDENASERFGREVAMVSAMDVHAEDSAVLESGQRGLSSGALEHIHFQSQEVLCRHFYQAVNTAVQAYQAGRQCAGGRV
jgi:phenylpropionate dioxygenase-like ring-hydroxylating dioxygenase large terminal subunit